MANNFRRVGAIQEATDEIEEVHYQRMKLVNATEDSTDPVGTDAFPLPVKFGSGEKCATVAEYNVVLTNANTEYSQALPAKCRKVILRCRTADVCRYAWVTNKVAAPTAPYQTLKANAEYSIDGIEITSGTLYFASATAGVVVEIEVWA